MHINDLLFIPGKPAKRRYRQYLQHGNEYLVPKTTAWRLKKAQTQVECQANDESDTANNDNLSSIAPLTNEVG
jgi:hypothetical protein